jgi:Winged helix DNA-binding domain
MDQTAIAPIRLASQHLAGNRLSQPGELIAWMGAMQSQDYPMARWAIGARLPGATDQEVEAAIDRAELIRTHVLRPTWHFVTPHDVYWMLDLTASRIKASQRARDRQLELSEEVYSKSNAILVKALRDGRHLTRQQLVAVLNKAGIATDQNRASHLFMRAELEGIIASGENHDQKPTYALLSERVKTTHRLSRDEALAELARRYFTSRGPATLQDFTWWSGLTAGDARQALDSVKPELHEQLIGERSYWMTPNNIGFAGHTPIVHLLPQYDEFTISYANRMDSINTEVEGFMKEISDRGIFRPIVIVNGQVMGIWKRTARKSSLLVEVRLFVEADEASQQMIIAAGLRYGKFTGMQTEVNL